MHSQLDLQQLKPIPPHGHALRQHWKNTNKPKGPIGLLLQQSHYFACAFDLHNFTLHRHAGPQVHVLHVPWQQLRPAMHRIASHAIFLAEAPHRTALQGAPGVDEQVFLKAVEELEAHPLNVVRSIATLSSVDQSLLHRIDHNTSSLCPFCKLCTSSVPHLLWFCSHPTLVQARHAEATELQKRILEHAEHLPAPIQLGIPPLLQLMPDRPWWEPANGSKHFLDLPNGQAASFGIQRYGEHDPFIKWISEQQHLDARTAFQVFDGAGAIPERPPLPSFVNGIPPEQVNVFSDGSFSLPDFPLLGLSTAGVWWPDRFDTGLSYVEECFADHTLCEDGLELFAFNKGSVGSSTRSEILGLLITACSNFP
eukprot:5833459-Karenia_brevis.AAC.1